MMVSELNVDTEAAKIGPDLYKGYAAHRFPPRFYDYFMSHHGYSLEALYFFSDAKSRFMKAHSKIIKMDSLPTFQVLNPELTKYLIVLSKN